jgi:hypothetical protein
MENLRERENIKKCPHHERYTLMYGMVLDLFILKLNSNFNT